MTFRQEQIVRLVYISCNFNCFWFAVDGRICECRAIGLFRKGGLGVSLLHGPHILDVNRGPPEPDTELHH